MERVEPEHAQQNGVNILDKIDEIANVVNFRTKFKLFTNALANAFDKYNIVHMGHLVQDFYASK